MGPADIATKLNVYTHLGYDDVEKQSEGNGEKLSGE